MIQILIMCVYLNRVPYFYWIHIIVKQVWGFPLKDIHNEFTFLSTSNLKHHEVTFEWEDQIHLWRF